MALSVLEVLPTKMFIDKSILMCSAFDPLSLNSPVILTNLKESWVEGDGCLVINIRIAILFNLLYVKTLRIALTKISH